MFMCHDNYAKQQAGEQWPHIINRRPLSLLAYTKFYLKHYNIVFSCRLINSRGSMAMMSHVLHMTEPSLKLSTVLQLHS